MRRLLGMALALALVGAGCGGDDEPDGAGIPPDRAKAITDQLDQVSDDVQNERCGGARFKLDELRKKIEALPRDVDQEVRDALADGMSKLESAVESECEQPEETTTEEAPPTTTEEAPPETTETQPEETTTETQPEETTTEEGPPPDTPPGDGGTPLPGDENGGADLDGDG